LPAWLQRNHGTGKVELIPERAKVIQKIFEYSRNGFSTGEIANRLTADRIPAWGTTGNWMPVYIMKILLSKTVLGFASSAAASSENADIVFPAVISQETWTAAQTARASNPSGPKTALRAQNLFPGLYYNSEKQCKMRVFLKRGQARYIVDLPSREFKSSKPSLLKQYLDYMQFEMRALTCIGNFHPKKENADGPDIAAFHENLKTIQSLIGKYNDPARPELRRLIRLVIKRIEVFPTGRTNPQSPAHNSGMPVYRIVFANGDEVTFG
jgi:hypothetical protein